MARRAIGLAPGTEALGGFRRRMLDMTLLLVARRAAIRRHGTHLVGSGRMTFHAFDLLPENVNPMTRYITRKTPRIIDVNASTPFSVLTGRCLRTRRHVLLVRASSEDRKREY